MVVDLGAGDGSAALRRARRDADGLSIAIEPVASALRQASHTAARPVRKGGLPNALFLCGSAEELPWRLAACVDELIVALPWAALLRGVALPEPQMVERLAETLRPGGRLELLLSVGDGDAAGGLPPLDLAGGERLAEEYRRLGFDCRELRPATREDVAELSAGWGRRLGIPERRAAFRLSLVR